MNERLHWAEAVSDFAHWKVRWSLTYWDVYFGAKKQLQDLLLLHPQGPRGGHNSSKSSQKRWVSSAYRRIKTFQFRQNGTFWHHFLHIVTDFVNTICLSRWGSESPLLHLFHSLEETQMTTPPQPHPTPRHWQHTITQTDAVSFHNDVVIWGVCVCTGRASRLTSVLFAVGVLWLHLQPGLTPHTCSQTIGLNVHICSLETDWVKQAKQNRTPGIYLFLKLQVSQWL